LGTAKVKIMKKKHKKQKQEEEEEKERVYHLWSLLNNLDHI
jgi:hypothetical protein